MCHKGGGRDWIWLKIKNELRRIKIILQLKQNFKVKEYKSYVLEKAQVCLHFLKYYLSTLNFF